MTTEKTSIAGKRKTRLVKNCFLFIWQIPHRAFGYYVAAFFKQKGHMSFLLTYFKKNSNHYQKGIIMTYQEVIEHFPMVRKYLMDAPAFIRDFSAREFPVQYEYVKKDQPVPFVSFICYGCLKCINEFYSGDAYTIDYALPGDIIGVESVLAGRNAASASLITTKPTVLFQIPRALFKNWLIKDSAFLMKIAVYIGNRQYSASYRSGRETAYPAIYRVAHCFLQSFSCENSGIIAQTRQNFADATGLSVKTINRAVDTLVEMNFINVVKGKVKISPSQKAQIEVFLENASYPSFEQRK